MEEKNVKMQIEKETKNDFKSKPIKTIGKYSFGISLILFGITIALQSFSKIDILRYVLTFWPAIFILLGIEIIHFTRKNNSNIKYDFASIFMIFVLVIFSQCFSVFNYGVNKILYNADVKNSIENSIEMQQYEKSLDANKKLTIINNSSKNIDVKQIQLDENTVEPYYIITCSYNQKKKNNIFSMYLSRDYLNQYINYDKASQTLVINDMSKFADCINLTIYTTKINNFEIKNY